MSKSQKIAVLVSGGVDSTVALRLLKDQGHDITAFYLKIWLEDELAYLGDCPWEEDLAFVRRVCEQADVPLQVINLQKEYWDQVVSYTIAEVKAGRTPNPDIFCNKRIKFGMFFDALAKAGQHFDKIASGHYAQVIERDGVYHLQCAPDKIKDQTYFLSYLSQEQLANLVFPIGHLTKDQVRELAQQYDVANKDRKDSQGICFLGKLKFSDFIKHYLGEQTGDLVEIETGQKMGSHNGFWYYTIGQRQGLGLAGGPWYVVKKDTVRNIVYISRSYHADDKRRDTFTVQNIHWLAGSRLGTPGLQVKLRHGAHRYACTLTPSEDGQVRVTLAERDQGIAPGQFAVLYDGDECVGSAVIIG